MSCYVILLERGYQSVLELLLERVTRLLLENTRTSKRSTRASIRKGPELLEKAPECPLERVQVPRKNEKERPPRV